jgi:hypothetical protein
MEVSKLLHRSKLIRNFHQGRKGEGAVRICSMLVGIVEIDKLKKTGIVCL